MDFTDTSTTINSQIAISNYLALESQEELVTEIINGFTTPQKQISSRFFYDDTGSSLFEDITNLPEYYPTRTEKYILKEIAPYIANEFKNIDIIELGSGDCSKISILLDDICAVNSESVRYIPVDVSRAAIIKSSDKLAQKYPQITIHGILTDFLKHLIVMPWKSKRLICFFGSTLGNLTQTKAIQFLMDLKSLMISGDELLVGMDMVKDVKILEDAYNDKQGITAAFNKNILNVVNDIIKTDFNPDLFEHVAFYNVSKSRIEMHLKALKSVEIYSLALPYRLQIRKDEMIHTENSHKFTLEYILNLSNLTGLKIKEIYTDQRQWFSLVHFIC